MNGKILGFTGAALALALLASPARGTESWDIENTGQPTTDVHFTLTEGTWMSVDVSPDGKTLVFDLLGDLYTMPSTGGRATAITQGPAIDRTASFSPDGSRILFMSDRSGFENIWSVSVDGGNPRMITDESVNVLANPVWSPDGEYIAVASMLNTFATQKQSEIRLYHASGGSGETLVDVPTNLRDVQEPDFSPDGRYLYYTKRLEDHNIVVVANHVNYGVMRRDMETGETTELVKGFGGALSPQVSPDGKTLAFVRRVKDKTVLFALDLETGRQRPVYDNLERDQQADFYQQGVYYPGFDWFPDNEHVAIWGKGKLFRVNMATGDAELIPFEADSHHKIITPPKFSDPLAPEKVDVKSVQSFVISPDGGTAVFHALGHLWVKGMPDGIPRRLTKDTVLEFEPAFSSDGKRLAFVAWDDEKGSQLMVSDLKGQRLRDVAASRGAIRTPVFSPDGTEIAFVVDEGGKSLGGYQGKAGLYRVALNGKPPIRIGDAVMRPQYAAGGDRLYFVRRSGGDRELASINLNGFDERVHAIARGADRSEISRSPDGRWIAFKENHQYYVLPYRETGQVTEITSSTASVPVRKLTTTSGYNITWSPGSDVLYWTLGADIMRADMDTDTASGKVAAMGLSVVADKPNGMVAFTGGRVITMKGDEVLEAGTVLVEGNMIKAVGSVEDVEIPGEAYVVDTTGKTVMPGLVDMHGHIACCYYGGLMPQKHPSHYAAAAFGVTTNYDPYTDELTAYAATEMQQAGMLVGPRFISTGKVIYGRPGKGDGTFVPLDDYDDALATMDRKRALGGRILKSYKQPSRRVRQQLVKAGREKGLMIDAEGESQFYLDISVFLDGHMALEHNIPVATYYDDIVKLAAASGVANTPTLNVTFGEMMGESYLYETTRAWENPKIQAYVQETTSGYSAIPTPYSAPVHVRSMTTMKAAPELWDVGFRSVSRSTRKLDEAGVIINSGSHGQVFGLALHWEMWSMAAGGMDPHRVLKTATINGAKTLGVEHEIGSLEAGKLADIIVMDKNPLADIHNSDSVSLTMVNGRLYDSLSMNEIGNYDRPRSKFYWELPDYNGIDWNEAWAGQ